MHILNWDTHDSRAYFVEPRFAKQFRFEGDPQAYTFDELRDICEGDEEIALDALEIGETSVVDGSLCERIEDCE